MARRTPDIIYSRTFDGRLSDRAYCEAVFARHVQAVRETIAPDRLLVFDVKEGWEPLCAFLGVPVPKGESFPHVNDSAEFHEFDHVDDTAAIKTKGGNGTGLDPDSRSLA